MPFYNSKGKIPKKRHTVFKNPKGGIYYEELVSREGFSYMYSNLYHLNMPTQIMKLGEFKKFENRYTYIKEDHKPYHFKSNNLSKLLLYNKDVAIYIKYHKSLYAFSQKYVHKHLLILKDIALLQLKLLHPQIFW